MKRVVGVWAALLLVLAGCSDDSNPKNAAVDSVAGDAQGCVVVDCVTDAAADVDATDPAAPKAQVFARGCPVAGRSLLRQLSAGETLDGPAALAAPGDWMLANQHAAFVVKAPTETEHTYGHYGGMLVDAVPLKGCEQAAPERFGELLLLLGNIEISDFTATTLRTFRGETAEILADGSDGGPAKLRIHGVDDRFWLVELTLIAEAAKSGKAKSRTKPLNVKLAIDYTLHPDRAAVQMDLVVINQTPDKRELHVGAAAFVDDSTKQQIWSGGSIGAGGFSLRTGLPWLAGSATGGAIAIAVDAKNLGTARISGVDALVPIDQLSDPLVMGPKGTASGGDTDSQTFWIGVGPTDSASAVGALEGLKVGGQTWAGVDVVGSVVDVVTGGAVAAAKVVLQRRNNAGEYRDLLSERSDAAGAFKIRVPKLGKAGDLRLQAVKQGRESGSPTVLSAAVLEPASEPPLDPTHNVVLSIGAEGAIEHAVVDEADAHIPARMLLVNKKTKAQHLGFATGKPDTWAVPPGNYTLYITRGYTHQPWASSVEVKAGKATKVTAKLPKVIDTAGWMAFDNHVHSGPSPDSTVPLASRYQGAAAEGLEVVVHSEHEIIIDSSPHLKASGVGAWVRGVAGQEVTASLPEHTNITGVVPDPKHRRGAPVKWHGKDLAEIWQLEKDRGAGFRTLNHPRKGCNWLCIIGWDRASLTWQQLDPESVGLAKGATLFSWDFEAMEVLNGHDSRLFIDQQKAHETGTFEDWLSFLNGGHRIAGLAVTDVHGWAQPGSPRTYFKVPSDDLSKFDQKWLVDAVRSGQVMMSTGAFAVASIAGVHAGGTVGSKHVEGGQLKLKLNVQALKQIDVTRIEVLLNCDTAAEIVVKDPNALVKFDGVVEVPVGGLGKNKNSAVKDSYVVVMGFGTKAMPPGMAGVNASAVPRFITNPIWIDVDGDAAITPPGAKSCTFKTGGAL
jgi:hypothetical protein